MRSVAICLLILALAAFLFVSSAFAQDAPPPERAPATPVKAAQVEVIKLQHALASDLAVLVSQALPAALQRGAKFIADSRTNSLIVSGQEADVSEVRSLVATLDVPQTSGKVAPARRSASFEVILFMIGPGSQESLHLPRTPTGVIDAADPDAVLAKLREAVGKPGVTELAKLSVMADDNRPWKSRQSAQIPMVNEMKGGTSFGGYQEAALDFSVSPESAPPGSRRLAIACKIERFLESDKSTPAGSTPPAKQTNTLEFSGSADDGKLVMAAVESGASRFEGSFILFVRVKG